MYSKTKLDLHDLTQKVREKVNQSSGHLMHAKRRLRDFTSLLMSSLEGLAYDRATRAAIASRLGQAS
jgi:DNA-binding transcriptional regulator/RsmH inhibitor MraZ